MYNIMKPGILRRSVKCLGLVKVVCAMLGTMEQQ